MTATLRVHAVEPASRANGPGVRATVWLQGCTLGCPGCFNPATHAADGPITPVAELVDRIAALPVDGLTVSGGEPFEQPDGLRALIEGVRARTGLSVLVFSGFTLEELRARAGAPAILALIDVLVDGRYRSGERLARGLRGSANQRIHLLSPRHTLAEVEATPDAEIRIDPAGGLVISGVAPIRVR
ncbi:MAG TPA: 4Fe-4S single cluster domain-containing protein [Kofleriaceae bacterium]|nr:4Fe-4S single cluster domain-containing protein [Kofleriaceae bacterium]